MQYRRSLIIVPSLLGALAANAQSLEGAYNLSNLTVQGTARSMGFGNALGSIGADFSTVSVNPAGLGVYRTSEMTFTPALRINSSSSEYQGVVTPDNNLRFNVNNFGLVFTNAPKGKRYEKKKWKAVSFGMGINRVADFNRNFSYAGTNSANSASQVFESDANHYPNDPGSTVPSTVPGYLGYQTYLLDSVYTSVVPFSGGVRQNKTVRERGKINEFALSLGGNYQEQLMLGATIGLPTIRHTIESSYKETLAPGNNAPNPANFSSFQYDQTLSIKGNGVNLKLGAIFKPTDEVRIGAVFHTPTVYAITESYTPSISTTVGNTNYSMSSGSGIPTDQFSYSFFSPWRGILSGAYVMKGVGFITVDYEYIGYSSMGYSYPDADANGYSYAQVEYDMNQAVANTYQSTSNVRVGLEGLITKFFMARAGFGYYGNPYKAPGLDGTRLDFSAGIGFREKEFFADIALVHSVYQMQFQPYSIDYSYVVSGPATPIPVATTDFGINNVAFTVGVKF